MMRKFINIIVTSLLLLSLFSCHGSVGMNTFVVPEEFDENKPYEITFWAKNDTNINQVNVYKKAISDFEALYPNITVNLKLYTDYSRIYNDVITNISTNTTPNVCISYPDHIATYLTGNNTVVDLDELINDEEYGLAGSRLKYDGPSREEMVEEFLNECIINDHYYALPFMRSTEALYINETYVKKLGYEIPDIPTWDWIWGVSEEATKTDEEGNFIINGQKIMIPFIYKSTDNMMISMLKQLDAGYSTSDGEVLIFNDTTKDLLYEISKHTANKAFSTFKISSYPANFLNAGQCIFAIDSTAGATWMGTNAPLLDIPADQIVEFETVVRPIPQFDINNPKMISQGPSICIFNKEDSGEVLASWLFMQYLLTNDVQIGYGKTEGYLPVTRKAYNDPDYVDYMNRSGEDNNTYYNIKIEASKLLLDNTQNTFVTPVFNGSASLRDAAGSLIENTCKSTNRKETIDDTYFNNLFEKLTTLYHLDQINTIGSDKDLGPLPDTAKILIGSLAIAWVLIGIYFVRDELKKKSK